VADCAGSFSAWVEEQSGLFDDASQTQFLVWMLRDYFLAEGRRRAVLPGGGRRSGGMVTCDAEYGVI
jgi:hypothetical protein